MNRPGIHKIENSEALQVYSSTRSIWRGNLWSSIHLNIKLDKHFLINAKNIGGRFVLRAYLKTSSIESYITEDKMHFKSCFNQNVRANQRHLLVTLDAYNTLDVEVHKDLFSCGDTFRVIVAAEDRVNNDAQLFFGASQTISVTDLSLSIEQRFLNSPYCDFVEEDVFVWYSKCGGEQSSLPALVHLKDANGNVPLINHELQLVTELVYEDGSPTPLNPICPLKDRKSGQTSKKPLFRLCMKPKLLSGKSCASFSFRIEEVTFHHSGHHGFKLKISLADSSSLIVHPAISSEIIVVLSKPKSGTRNAVHNNALAVAYKSDTRKSVHMSEDNTSAVAHTKKRKVSTVMNENVKPMLEVPVSVLITGYRVNGKCLCCMKVVSTEQFLVRGAHNASCTFATGILPATLGSWHKQECNHNHLSRSDPLSFAPTKKKTSSNDRLICDLSMSKTVLKKDTQFEPLPHIWSGPYESKHNPCIGRSSFTNHESDCSWFPLNDTVKMNEKHFPGKHLCSDGIHIKKENVHYLSRNIDTSLRDQGDESVTFHPYEHLRDTSLRDQGDESVTFHPYEHLRDICMEENEKYLLQEFSAQSYNSTCSSHTDHFAQEAFNVDDNDDDCLVSSIEISSSDKKTCTIFPFSNTDSCEKEEDAFCCFSKPSDIVPMDVSKSSKSPQPSESFKSGHNFVDADSLVVIGVDLSSPLYEPITLPIENLHDSTDMLDHKLVGEITPSGRITPVIESVKGSPLADIPICDDTNLDINAPIFTEV